jgi:hypothetical protein
MTNLSPVSLSERLPGPDDVNEYGNCWLWDAYEYQWDWAYVRTKREAEFYDYTHWLPANALPLPTESTES